MSNFLKSFPLLVGLMCLLTVVDLTFTAEGKLSDCYAVNTTDDATKNGSQTGAKPETDSWIALGETVLALLEQTRQQMLANSPTRLSCPERSDTVRYITKETF